ncbi:MAG: DUF3800 domain-containing protein [Candidatus Tectomicrobia bacterium]|nr:DUF3800 domain-containing protein [Candidatus Tectomicrobia bacterium]
MYLLYLDESGNPDDPSDRHFVLAGAAVFELTTFHLSQEMERLQQSYFPGIQPVEFHAAAIRNGKGFWRNQDRSRRDSLLGDIGEAIENSNRPGWSRPGVVLFAAVIEKTNLLYGEEAVKKATEEICRRFDLFLMRRHQEHGDSQRGLLVLDEGRFQARSKIWVKDFRTLGTQWGTLRNLSDIPYFTNSVDTRLLQVADYVSHAAYLMYERRDYSLFARLLSRFDAKDGTIHGLSHIARSYQTCTCPACASKRSPGSYGDWISS